MGFKHISPSVAAEAKRRYEAGESIDKIAEELGYSPQGLRQRIKRDGAKIRRPGGVAKHVRQPRQTMIEIPMAMTPKKVAVIVCDPSSVAEVVGSLWK